MLWRLEDPSFYV
jgi:hypothetical protein